MTGGATQLALSGGQDKYLHMGADAGFFDSRHISYEDFAIESVEITAQGQIDFRRTAKFKFINSAELVTGAYLEITLPQIDAPAETANYEYFVAWVHMIGFYVFESVNFVVNSTTIDTHYPEFCDMWSRLITPASKREGYNDMIGDVNILTRFGHGHNAYPAQVDPDCLQLMAESKPQTVLTIPLMFWWCNDYNQALPIGILLFCEIYVNVQFKAASDLYEVYERDKTPPNNYAVSTATITTPSLVDVKLYVDYVFLNNASRNRIAVKKHFYVIKQTRTNGPQPVTGASLSYRLPFVMPVSELLFGVREDAATTAKAYHIWDRYTGNAGDINDDVVVYNIPDPVIQTATLKIMTDERFSARGYGYWSRYVPYKHHTTIPSTKGIFAFSFALWPEKCQASGACNFSSADNNYLNLTFNQSDGKDGTASVGIGNSGITGMLYVYSINYNYIYIDSGYLTVLFTA